jgi:hypothetical protein
MSQVIENKLHIQETKSSNTFFEERTNPLGVTEDNNIIELFNPEAEFPAPKLSKAPIFREDRKGNIVIAYYTIEGERIVYYNDNKTPMPRFYETIRLKAPRGDMKYKMPKGRGTFPWFSPWTVEKYKQGKKIETLFLTEGVFKAWRGCLDGLDVVGLSSITHYRQHDGEIYQDVQKLIEKCLVQNIVILWDGDCLDISEGAVSVREDLTKRPKGFFSAAKKMRKLISQISFKKNREAPQVYFMHVKSEIYDSKPKGLDDLLVEADKREQLKQVIQDALALEKKGPFFYKMNITRSTEKLYRYFNLKDVDTFYKIHMDKIGENDFYFHGDLYRYNDEQNELELLAPRWAQKLRWIGDEFFIDLIEPSARGDQRVLKKYLKATLKDLYGNDFIKYIKHYAGFCNVPSHFNFEQVLERDEKKFYNRYFPFAHIPKQGEIDVIIGFLKHIFGEKECTHAVTGEKIPSYELGLDYIQLLLQAPTQVLPVLCLYSPENNTGKSTLGNLMKYIFKDNVVELGNSDFQSDFNEPYADKLLAICEEALLERKENAELIKKLATNKSVLVNPKGQRQYTIDFFCKFWFFSNNIRMVYLTKHDERYWILKVSKPKKDNPHLEDQMKEQVPAFIHFLKNRKMKTRKESRMWFHRSLLKTDIFTNMVEINEPADASDLREALKEWFIQDPSLKELKMPMLNIKAEFFKNKSSITVKWLREILTDHLGVSQQMSKGGKVVSTEGKFTRQFYNEFSNEWETKTVEWKGRPYVFKRDDFVNDDDFTTEYPDNEDDVFKKPEK